MAQMTDAQWREFVMAGTRTGKLAEEYGQRNGVPGELLVRIHISKVIAQREIAS